MNVNRLNEFKELLDSLESWHLPEKENYKKYIGTGNPNGEILIIGKECAVDEGNMQHKIEITNNYNDWKRLIKDDNLSQNQVLNYFQNIGIYSPLYPYRGQTFKIDNGRNTGTSRTWYNYQKLHNEVYGIQSTHINFHENFFLMEVNAGTHQKTKLADKSSISDRKKLILDSTFVQSFPVIIIAGVGYFDINCNKNEIEELFNVRFDSLKYADEEKQKQPYWVHIGNEPNRTKLLINTYQLSIGISNSLIEKVAKEINAENRGKTLIPS